MGFALKTCRYGCPSHYYAAGGRLRVGDVGPKLRGVLLLPVSLIYQKMTTPSRTTKTQPLIAALEKWRVPTQQAACDTIHRKLTQQFDLPLKGLVNDSFMQLPRRKIIPYPSTTTPNNTVNLLLQKCLYFPDFTHDANRCWKYLPITNTNHWIY